MIVWLIDSNQVDAKQELSVAVLINQCKSKVKELKLTNRKDPRVSAVLESGEIFVHNNSTEYWEEVESSGNANPAQP